MSGIIGNRPYDLKSVQVTVNGVPLSGASDGDFIAIAPNANVYDKTPGARGEYAISKTNDDGGTITISIFQGSRVNRGLLDNVVRTQKIVGIQPGTFATITVEDLQTGEVITCARCWIETEPTRNFGASQQAREYVFATDEIIVSPLS